jgi:3-dehydroquinate dehydratase II
MTDSSTASNPLRTGTRAWRIAVINGTNMSNLVNRDPARFGPPMSIDELDRWTVETGRKLGLAVTTMHSNHDGVIIEWLHEHAYGPHLDGILINPAGLTNYAEHVRHCLEECRLPYIEMHFANIAQTGHNSVFTRTATGLIQGFRKHTYAASLLAMANILDDETFPKPKRGHPLP